MSPLDSASAASVFSESPYSARSASVCVACHSSNCELSRSEKPSSRKGKLFYYEILLKGTAEAQLRRYQATHEGDVDVHLVGMHLASRHGLAT